MSFYFQLMIHDTHLSGWGWGGQQGLGRSGGGSVLFRRAGSISLAYLRGSDQESTALEGGGSMDGLLNLMKIYPQLFACFHIMQKGPKLSLTFQRLGEYEVF